MAFASQANFILFQDTLNYLKKQFLIGINEGENEMKLILPLMTRLTHERIMLVCEADQKFPFSENVFKVTFTKSLACHLYTNI